MAKPKKQHVNFSEYKKKIIPKIKSKKGFGENKKETFKLDSNKKKRAIKLINEGNLLEAEVIYRDLLKRGTKDHIVIANLAALFSIKGEKKEAKKLLNEALKYKPDFSDAHNNLAILQKDEGDLNTAINSFRKAIQHRPDYSEAHCNLGVSLIQKGNLNEAIESFQKAIKYKPSYPEAFYYIGNIHKTLGEVNKAINSYKLAIKYKPKYPEAFNNLGLSYKAENNVDLAISCFKKAINLKTEYSEALNNLGNTYRELGNFKDAINYLGQAISSKPDFAEAINNLGTAYEEEEKFKTSINYYEKAIKIKPDYPEAYFNLANSLRSEGQIKKAIRYYKHAISLKPNFPSAYKNLSLAELLSNDYESGWIHHEWRWKIKNSKKPHAEPKTKRWEGEVLKKERLLIVSEQGFGDTLQFMRYIKHIKEIGIDVSFCAQTKLHGLIKASGIHQNPLTSEEANKVSDGKWIPLMSLPKFLNITPDNPIITDAYISTTDELFKKWKNIFSEENKPIIGINWQGNPKAEKNNLKGRSLPLAKFASLAKNTNFKLLSLQKGFGSEQLNNCLFRDEFTSIQTKVDSIWEFLEMAAIIANCKLIITSDTYVAHLAGGMGKPTWLLLQKIPDWRWGLNYQNSFWYPSLKLFRQRERNNWSGVMKEVKIELETNPI